MTNVGIKLRLAALGAAVALIGGAIVVVTVNAEVQAARTTARLGQMDVESFRIADRFREVLRRANDNLRHYASAREPAVWEDFTKASGELKAWIDQQRPVLATVPERELLKKMDDACRLYLQKAQDLRARMETSGESTASLAEYNDFSRESRRLLDLGQDLARSHYEARQQVLAQASRTVMELRVSILILVGLLFVLGLTLVAGVYRDLIRPLRVKLVETQAIADRNEKLASLGLLAAGVAHEIRNPLTAIKTGLFSQQKRLPPGSPAHRDGEIIEREIARLERIVTEFLQFARPAEPVPLPVPADRLLEDVEVLLSPQLAEAGIELIREQAHGLQVEVDPAQIEQVLINLVQNAADSTGHGGRVTLRARADRKRMPQGEIDVVILEVADTGKGISPEIEKRLFDPFFTTKDQGTGLGLSIAMRVVEKNGGALQYQTQVNRGTTFGVVLPRIL
jgi:signal transduction histidine kinase